MALTPEDVVNKRFQPTKFREGYDQDEVDDFLDEVVVELRRLNQENEELRQRLIASDSRIAELQRSGATSAAPAAAAETVAQPVVEPAVETPAATSFGTPGLDETGSTNNLLQLARRLHEEHVREGIEKRDALIAEGHATAARVVGEAEAQQRQAIGALEQERTVLEAKVEELRTFEREYRQKLKSYIESQLSELENSAPVYVAPSGNAGAQEGAADTPSGFAAPAGVTPPAGATPPPASYQGFGGN
jgi:DivIVA domain-containing protein